MLNIPCVLWELSNDGFKWSVCWGFGFSDGVKQNKKKPKSSFLIRQKKKKSGFDVNEWQMSKYLKEIWLKNNYNKTACIPTFIYI